MRQFNNTAILTSKNSEAFLNFIYDGSEYWIIPDACIANDTLYVNGIDINNYLISSEYALKLDATNNIASFLVHSDLNYNFNANLSFTFYENETLSSDVSIHDVSILNRPYIVKTGAINTYPVDNILVDDEASYLVLRTNPKFTGNIALYVDCSENIFLDTFKVSDILSNKKYRKQQISSNSFLSNDIRRTFSTLPRGELYKVDTENTLSVGIPKTEFKDQFNNTYNYGARLLKDDLYKEDNGILAPLWINSKLPDYFSVFRLKGVYNQETYDGSSLSNLALKYLQNSDIIKSWSLKPDAPLGKYLNTHLHDLTKIQSPVFLSLSDPIQNESDPNTWYGMAVDKGVITGRSETTYFFNEKTNNYTDLNAFISQGFERNSLLCPNLINMNFIFDDNDVSLYKMNRYFGFYLSENVLYNIAYYSDTSTGNIKIISLDGKDSSIFFNSNIFDSSGNIIKEYSNRLFVLNDGINLKRITNINQIDETLFNEYVSKPYENIFSTKTTLTNINPFITLTLNNRLQQGEHLRIINKSQNKIWEIYAVDASQYGCKKYCSVSENDSYPTVYRTYFDISGSLSQQIREIELAFDRFADYENIEFRSGVRGNNWMSIVLNDNAIFSDEWVFQRITASTLNDIEDINSGFNNAANESDITFFGRFTPSISDYETLNINEPFGPIDFELFGKRRGITINLINRNGNNLYSCDSSQNILDKFQDITLYQDLSLWYRKLQTFDVSSNLYLYVKDPLSITDKVLIMSEKPILTINNIYNAYSIYPLNISLMGINPVKDIDYTIYDTSLGFKSEYFYDRTDDVSSYSIYLDADSRFDYVLDIPGSYIIVNGTGTITKEGVDTVYSEKLLFNTFDSSVSIQALTPTLISYAIIDGSFNYSVNSLLSEENIDDYFDSKVLLKYGLTVPLISKWVGLGTDVRNNALRLKLDTSINFIPTENLFTQEISYPSFKYLTPGENAWKDYIFYDINDVIIDNGEYKTFKDLMFEYPEVDYFSKLVYSNYNVNSKKARSSIVYYNGYKDALDVIITGLNLSMKVRDNAKNVLSAKNYDRYRFSFISTASRNKSNKYPIEVIINENTETILMIWYQGNDELNYNKRYSSYLPGKSLLDPSNNGFVTGTAIDSSYYSFIKTPFYVNNSTIAKTLINFYDIQTNYDSDIANPYAQYNKNTNGFNSLWNSFGNNTLFGLAFNSTKSYNTFGQKVNYSYITNGNTFGNFVVNYGYRYNSNENLYTNNTTNLITLKSLLSNNQIMFYVIREDDIISSYNFSLNPFIVSINEPRMYKKAIAYNGWYKPKFNTIIEFKDNEEADLINTVNKDFIFGNTNLRVYNDILQVWYNKLVSNVTPYDVYSGKAINYIKNFNVFKALWDANYFIKDEILVDGYKSSYELPSFFGSKLIKLPKQLIIENWNKPSVLYNETLNEITFNFNLTTQILSMLKTNLSFLSNWGSLSNENIIDAYIKNTILSYYNLTSPKINVEFYTKSFKNRLLYLQHNDNFIKDDKLNFNGQLLYINDEYIYKITIPKLSKYSYFVKITLIEK